MQHVDTDHVFNDAMTSLAKQVNRDRSRRDFARFATIVDVGGGHGALLSDILHASPSSRGVLFDQPHVIANTQIPLAQAGLAETLARTPISQPPGKTPDRPRSYA
jgi:hypothetical protein